MTFRRDMVTKLLLYILKFSMITLLIVGHIKQPELVNSGSVTFLIIVAFSYCFALILGVTLSLITNYFLRRK
jgi:hypothetical protein